jgi:large conductance mechanosensitive channel
MSGFKNFILRGNLVDLAVAVIIGTSFGTVVSAFTTWLTNTIPGIKAVFDGKTDLGKFLNALVAFIILAAVVYFFVVVPYTKAKEKYFPEEAAGTPADVALLEEIRDLLAAK